MIMEQYVNFLTRIGNNLQIFLCQNVPTLKKATLAKWYKFCKFNPAIVNDWPRALLMANGTAADWIWIVNIHPFATNNYIYTYTAPF